MTTPFLSSGRHLAMGLCWCASSFLIPLGAVAAPLTEAEALRLFKARPELADWSQARLGEAEADEIAARTWSNPTLELERERAGSATGTAWKIAQPIDFSGRRGLREEAAKRRRDAVAGENAAVLAERMAEVRRTFHEVLREQASAQAVEAWAARFSGIGSVVDKLARAGEASGYDRRRLAREQRAAEARLAELRAELEHRTVRLAGLIGQKQVEGASGRLLPDRPPALPELQARLAERPDLAALSARADAASADNAASRRQFPELTVGLGGKRSEDDNGRQSVTMFSLEIPLPIFERQQAGDRRSAAQAQAARAEHALARHRAETELTGLHRKVEQLVAVAGRFRGEAVAPSAELVRIAEAAYRAGEGSVIELLDAYKGALDAELTALDLEWKARQARIELDQMTGQQP